MEDHIDLSGCNQAHYTGTCAQIRNDLISNSTASSNVRFSFTFQTFDGKYWAIKILHSSEFPNEESINPLENAAVNDDNNYVNGTDRRR